MKITGVTVEPLRDRLVPALRFQISAQVSAGTMPIAVSGVVRAGDRRILGELRDGVYDGGAAFVSVTAGHGKTSDVAWSLALEATPRVVEHIDAVRRQSPRGDVTFTVELRVRVAVSVGSYLPVRVEMLQLADAPGRQRSVGTYVTVDSLDQATAILVRQTDSGFIGT